MTSSFPPRNASVSPPRSAGKPNLSTSPNRSCKNDASDANSALKTLGQMMHVATGVGLRTGCQAEVLKQIMYELPAERPLAESRSLHGLLCHIPQVMYDANGIRLQAGRQPQTLNQIVSELPADHPLAESVPVHELLGHTPPQVMYAATGVGLQAGHEAEVLNQIACEFPPEHTLSGCRSLCELLGHTSQLVMYDATGVGLQAGHEAEVLNQIACEFPPEHTLSGCRSLCELLGHTFQLANAEKVKESANIELDSLLLTNAEKLKESPIPGLQLLLTADSDEATDNFLVLERKSLIRRALSKLKPGMALVQGQVEAKGRQAYKAVKETVKWMGEIIVENPKEAKDIAEKMGKVVSKQEPAPPSPGSLQLISEEEVGFFKWITGELLLLVLSLVGFFFIYVLTSSSISTYGLGDSMEVQICWHIC